MDIVVGMKDDSLDMILSVDWELLLMIAASSAFTIEGEYDDEEADMEE